MRKLLSLVMLGLVVAGCGSSPVGPDERQLLRQLTPVVVQVPPQGPPNPWWIYQDALNTQLWVKGLDFYGGGSFGGTPVIDLACTVSPANGADCMHLGIAAQTTSWYCGMILLQDNGFTASNASPGVDISAGGYTKCIFSARVGSGACPVNFQAGNSGSNTLTPTLTTAWQTYTINLTDTSKFTQMRQFFVIALGDSLGTVTPCDVYVDDLRYAQ